MEFAAAVVMAEAAIGAVPEDGLANGTIYANSSMPATSHIRPCMKWPLADDGTPTGLADQICRYAKVHLSEAERNAEPSKADIDSAVIVAIARAAAWKFYHWSDSSLNPPEVERVAAGVAEFTVHADFQDAVAEALERWAAVAPRYMALFFYNAISYEVCSHHHLPAVTKKLASTTIALTGLKEWMAGDPAKEGIIFHDAFHPVADMVKSTAARNMSAQDHLSGLKFDNLRKRIPVKAPDSGIALNYATLFAKARGYTHNPEHLPDELGPPISLGDAVELYREAADAEALRRAVKMLRIMSETLAEPSAYLAGYILGRECEAVADIDLDLRTAARTTTILGSPAYQRAAGEFSGTFAAGKAMGFQKVSSEIPSQVLPRCVEAVELVSALDPARVEAAAAFEEDVHQEES